jgi:hypothetical protein
MIGLNNTKTMNEFPSIDLMIGQLNKSIKDIEATSMSSENYVLRTLNATLRLALDIKNEEMNYFKSKNN